MIVFENVGDINDFRHLNTKSDVVGVFRYL